MQQDTFAKSSSNAIIAPIDKSKTYSSNSSRTPLSVQSNTKKSIINSQAQSPLKQSQKAGLGGKNISQSGDNQIQYYQKVIKELETEINQLKCAQKAEENFQHIIEELTTENKYLKEKYEQSEYKREELQDKIVSSSNIQQEVQVKIDRFQNMVFKENEDFRNQLILKDKELREKDSRIDYLRAIVQQNELEKQEMKLKLEEAADKVKDNQGNVFESEQKRVQLQREYQRSLDDYNLKLSQQYGIQEKLSAEIEALKNQIRDQEKIQGQMKLEKLAVEKQLQEEKDKNKKMNETNKIMNDIRSERDLLMKQLEQYFKDREDLSSKLNQLRDETENLLNKVKADLKQLGEAKRNLERELFEKDEEIAKKDIIIKNLTQKQLELGEAMTKFQRFLDAHNDLKRQLEDAKFENDMLRDAKSQAHQDLMDANKLLDIAALGSEDYQKKIKELMDRMKEQDDEIEAMKLYVSQMRAKFQIYIPDKEDTIDNQLAEYINNYPERSKLRIMFMKESEGIYHFGSRRVYVKVERDKITVRVGGGYLSIDEFLDIYTPMELERVERNDPIKKFSEKVAVQKTLQFHSPVRSPKQQNDQDKEKPKKQVLGSPRQTLQKSGTQVEGQQSSTSIGVKAEKKQ